MTSSPLKSQVVSLQLSRRLKELGVPQEGLFYWVEFKTFPVKPWQILSKDELRTINFPELAISAFLVGELGEMLPGYNYFWCFSFKTSDGKYSCVYEFAQTKEIKHQEYGETEADARAKMLIHLLENNLIKASDL